MMNDQETTQFFSPAAKPENLAPGMFLGKEKNYRLEKYLGAGGMGHVWLATEIEDGVELRKVVCKILPALVQRETREMEKVLKTFHLVQPLNHPNICPIYGLKSDPGCGYFFVMGYADGGTLEDWFRKQPDYANGLPVSQVAEILRPVAQALDYAHEMGIMHRDVKPQNILFVTRKDRKMPWLIDFGISAQIHSTTTQTLNERGSSGTPAYMAPEQCQSRLQDGRTDQYALGVLAYQLLSDRLPFEADNAMALWNKIVYNPVPPLTNVSAQANAAVKRAMAKDRKDRFASCVEFVDALIGEKPSAPSHRHNARPWPWVAGIIALLMIGVCLFVTFAKHAETMGPTLPVPSNELSIEQPKPDEAESVIPTETAPKQADAESVAPTAAEGDFVIEGSTITEYKGSEKNVVIPAVINGQNVKRIGVRSFDDSSIISVVIPDGVTEIEGAFSRCHFLKSVVIPQSVIAIRQYAFMGCISLTSIEIPEGVKEIGNHAFSNCSSLKTVRLPDSVEEIAGATFAECTALKELSLSSNHPFFKTDGTGLLTKDGKKLVTCLMLAKEYRIPDGVVEIGDWAFSYCRSLKSVVIPDSVKKIGERAFQSCDSLKSVKIPEGVKSIETGTFFCCHSLTSVEIPESVTTIGDMAFKDCLKLTIRAPEGSKAEEYAKANGIPFESVTSGPKQNETANEADFVMSVSTLMKYRGSEKDVVIPAVIGGRKVKYIGNSAFRNCSTITSVVIPEGVTEIGDWSFPSCHSLKSVVIPKSVKTIKEGAFVACAFTSVEIPEGVTEIGDQAFLNCHSLTSVTLPDSLEKIGGGAFSECTALKEWSVSPNQPYFKTDGTGLLTKDGKKLVACLPSAKEYRIPDGVTEIGAEAFSYSSISSVVIPQSVTKIGERAFELSHSLTSIVLPEGLKEIGTGAFACCSSLVSVVIPDSVEEIGGGAFRLCKALKEWTISPNHPFFKKEGNGLLTKDGKKLVACLTSAEEYHIPESVTEIESCAFVDCSLLPSAEIPEGVTVIGDHAFMRCTSLTSVEIPEGVMKIEKCTFMGCNSLTSLTIPGSVTEIGIQAFEGCPQLTIHAPKGSKAEEYAKEKGIPFEAE